MVRAGHIDPLIRRHRRQLPPACPSRAGCRSGCPPSSGSLDYPVDHRRAGPRPDPAAVHRRPGRAARRRPRRRHAAARPRWSRAGPRRRRRARRPAHRRGRGAAAATTTWRCCCCAAAAGTPQQAGGRLQQHVAPGDPEALTEARHMIRRGGPRLGRAGARRRDRAGRRRADHQRPDAHRGRRDRDPAGPDRPRPPAAGRGRGLLQRPAAPPGGGGVGGLRAAGCCWWTGWPTSGAWRRGAAASACGASSSSRTGRSRR